MPRGGAPAGTVENLPEDLAPSPGVGGSGFLGKCSSANGSKAPLISFLPNETLSDGGRTNTSDMLELEHAVWDLTIEEHGASTQVSQVPEEQGWSAPSHKKTKRVRKVFPTSSQRSSRISQDGIPVLEKVATLTKTTRQIVSWLIAVI